YYLAFLDAMNAPEVLFIDTGEYNGKIGNPIMVEAIDNFQVKDVRIEIFSKSGGLIEQGFAVQQKCTLYWKYKATKENPWVTGTRIVATAIDLPGNEQSMEIFI
ncbi:MAG: hypothetical protein J7497_17160, partial [Chitinophagaceae bacterium]|nr:hypothetical protein [Chitinophagaceae bacterium]